MSSITWKELKDFLNNNLDDTSIWWNKPVMLHNIETGDEYTCDTLVFEDRNRLVLVINNDE